jgi:hypothetical protein
MWADLILVPVVSGFCEVSLRERHAGLRGAGEAGFCGGGELKKNDTNLFVIPAKAGIQFFAKPAVPTRALTARVPRARE